MCHEPVPSPTSTRPPLDACATASCPASSSGGRNDAFRTWTASRMWEVAPAIAVRSVGASHAASPPGAALT